MIQILLPALRVFLRENTSESERVTVSSKLRQLILVLNNITLFKPIICHVCGANCVDALVLILFLSSTFFSSSSLKCFFNSLFGSFFTSKCRANVITPTPLIQYQCFSTLRQTSCNLIASQSALKSSYDGNIYIYTYIFFSQPVNTSLTQIMKFRTRSCSQKTYI